MNLRSRQSLMAWDRMTDPMLARRQQGPSTVRCSMACSCSRRKGDPQELSADEGGCGELHRRLVLEYHRLVALTFERAARELGLDYEGIDFDAAYRLDRRGLIGGAAVRPLLRERRRRRPGPRHRAERAARPGRRGHRAPLPDAQPSHRRGGDAHDQLERCRPLSRLPHNTSSERTATTEPDLKITGISRTGADVVFAQSMSSANRRLGSPDRP